MAAKVSDLAAFEVKMKAERAWNRARFCVEIGLDQSTLRRTLAKEAGSEVGPTIGLAMAAIDAGLSEWGSPPP